MNPFSLRAGAKEMKHWKKPFFIGKGYPKMSEIEDF